MSRYFEVFLSKNKIKISTLDKNSIFVNISIYLDNIFFGTMSLIDTIILTIPKWKPKILLIQADLIMNGYRYKINEFYNIIKKERNCRESKYRAGDILIACDNMNGLPYGYMGHTALVVDHEMIVESVVTNPIVRKIPIQSFTNDHPLHAHFRPKTKEMGEKAANYALAYLKKFEENKKMGIPKPSFYFSLNTPLHDEWTYIYCTKLVWLSYYYGANYPFINDHLWFSPEDLYTNLKSNPNFELIYIHPNFRFFIDL